MRSGICRVENGAWVLFLSLAFLAFAGPARADPGDGADQGAEFRPATDWRAPRGLAPSQRDLRARLAREPVVRRMFAKAGVAWPPARMLFRVFKEERELEVWASGAGDEPMKRVATYGICSAPRTPGPKSRQGDNLVPEGFYRIDAFNPASAYHLSMRVSYPNAWDRRRSRARPLGGAIMIHGNCVSIGCLSMTDERIEELWVMAQAVRAAGHAIDVNLYPARDLRGLIEREADPELAAFWRTLLAGNEQFERTRRPPRPGIRDGRYAF